MALDMSDSRHSNIFSNAQPHARHSHSHSRHSHLQTCHSHSQTDTLLAFTDRHSGFTDASLGFTGTPFKNCLQINNCSNNYLL